MMDRLRKLTQKLLQIVEGIFFRNLHLKAIALLLTFALYLWVGEDRETQIIASAPIQFSIPQDQMLLEPTIDQVKVTLRGRWSTLNEFDETNLRPVVVQLDNSDDERLVPITPESVQIPPGLRVVSIEPSFVRVDMEKKTRRKLPVEPRIVGRTRGSYQLGEVTVDPEQVPVAGPEEAMREMNAIPTEPIDVTGRVRSFKKRVQLRPDDPLINYKLDGPVTVSVPIRAEKIEKSLDNIEVVAVNTTYATRISPDTFEATIRGPRSVVESVDADTLHAVIDLTNEDDMSPGTFEKKAELRNLPSDVEIVDRHPTHFVVETTGRPSDDESR